MQNIETLFIITFGIYALLLMASMLLGYLLFKSLKKSHVDYYKSIGEPIVMMPAARLSDTEEELVQNYVRTLKSGTFTYRMVFRGIPKNFPKDIGLRKLAKVLRIISTIMLVSFVAFIVAGYLFYKSGL